MVLELLAFVFVSKLAVFIKY